MSEMHRCAIEVDGVNYATLHDSRAIHDFMYAIAKRVYVKVASGPTGTQLHTESVPEHTILWMIALEPRGYILFNAHPHRGWFALDISCEKGIRKQEMLDLIEQHFGKRDSIGRRVASHPMPEGADIPV